MPLHWAASGGHTNIVKYLLDLRVPIDEKDDVSVPHLVSYVVLGTQDNPPTELTFCYVVEKVKQPFI